MHVLETIFIKVGIQLIWYQTKLIWQFYACKWRPLYCKKPFGKKLGGKQRETNWKWQHNSIYCYELPNRHIFLAGTHPVKKEMNYLKHSTILGFISITHWTHWAHWPIILLNAFSEIFSNIIIQIFQKRIEHLMSNTEIFQ